MEDVRPDCEIQSTSAAPLFVVETAGRRKHYTSKGKPYEMIGFRHVLIYKNKINTTQL